MSNHSLQLSPRPSNSSFGDSWKLAEQLVQEAAKMTAQPVQTPRPTGAGIADSISLAEQLAQQAALLSGGGAPAPGSAASACDGRAPAPRGLPRLQPLLEPAPLMDSSTNGVPNCPIFISDTMRDTFEAADIAQSSALAPDPFTAFLDALFRGCHVEQETARSEALRVVDMAFEDPDMRTVTFAEAVALALSSPVLQQHVHPVIHARALVLCRYWDTTKPDPMFMDEMALALEMCQQAVEEMEEGQDYDVMAHRCMQFRKDIKAARTALKKGAKATGRPLILIQFRAPPDESPSSPESPRSPANVPAAPSTSPGAKMGDMGGAAPPSWSASRAESAQERQSRERTNSAIEKGPQNLRRKKTSSRKKKQKHQVQGEGEALLSVLQTLFEEADKDSSGEIDPDELAEVMRQVYRRQGMMRSVASIRRQVDSLIAHYDRDDTGSLSFNEFVALFCFNPAFKLQITPETKALLAELCNVDPNEAPPAPTPQRTPSGTPLGGTPMGTPRENGALNSSSSKSTRPEWRAWGTSPTEKKVYDPDAISFDHILPVESTESMGDESSSYDDYGGQDETSYVDSSDEDDASAGQSSWSITGLSNSFWGQLGYSTRNEKRKTAIANLLAENQETVNIIGTALEALPGGLPAKDNWQQTFDFLSDEAQLKQEIQQEMQSFGGKSIDSALPTIADLIRRYIPHPAPASPSSDGADVQGDARTRYNEINADVADPMSSEDWADFVELLFHVQQLQSGTAALTAVMAVVKGHA